MEAEISDEAETPRLLRNLTADFSGSYSWGDYEAPGQPDDSHSGMALQLSGGYRFDSGLALSPAATFAFPQISVPNSLNDAAFSYTALGAQASYIWRNRLEPFVQYFPFARLSQTSTSRVDNSQVRTDLSYLGQTYGAGMKVYLTQPRPRTVQVGLKFSYAREAYHRATVESKVESLNGRPASLNTAAAAQAGEQEVSGNTYQLGVFIGI